MNLPKPQLSPRFFIYFLFILVVLILVGEGGYYFWAQRETRKQSQNPVIARQEGVFSYVNLPDGTTQKMILGKIEKIDDNLLTIKTDNNKTVQVLFTGENPLIANLTSGTESTKLEKGTVDELLIGDTVRIAEIDSENERQITTKSLVIIKGAIK